MVNQSTARARCLSQNADLVSISDEEENNFVTSIWSVD